MTSVAEMDVRVIDLLRRVLCLHCHAAPGKPCTFLGRVLIYHHPARWDAAQRVEAATASKEGQGHG